MCYVVVHCSGEVYTSLLCAPICIPMLTFPHAPLSVKWCPRSARNRLDPMAGQHYPLIQPDQVDSAANRAAALTAAEESIVLLKNDGCLLPLAASAKVAFIGPHANSTQALLSNYFGRNTLVDSHSPLQAAVAAGMHVTYTAGCNICDVVPAGFPNMPCVRLSLALRISPQAGLLPPTKA